MKKHLVLTLLLASAATSFAQAPAPTPTPAPGQPGQQPAPPQGQPATGDDDAAAKKAKAKAAYDRGLSHYNLGEFDAAITEFKDAYAISSAPGLLFNIAQSYRLKKDYEQATYFYTTYLRLKPDAPNREDVEARLKEMDDLIKQQKEMDAKKPTGVISPEGTGTGTGTGTTTTVVEKEKPQPEGGVPPKTLITAGYATAGAGAALLITGAVFGSMARSNQNDLNKLSTNMGTWSQDAQDKYDAGRRDNKIAIVSFIVGGAAVVTGGTLWFLGTQKKKRMESVAIVPTAHGTTFAVGWSF